MYNHERKFSLLDQLIISLDKGLSTLFKKPEADVPNPAASVLEDKLSKEESRRSAGLMRVNHTGEVCAQALYQGQALTARNQNIRQAMAEAAQEEVNHLSWCKDRLTELHSHTSYLNPVWYMGSFSLGVLAGIAGDKWSLGFLKETELQVGEHLQSHLQKLPAQDHKSHKIVSQMYTDEIKHADMAAMHGAAELPGPVKVWMRFNAKIMTTIAYWV